MSFNIALLDSLSDLERTPLTRTPAVRGVFYHAV